MQQIQHQLLQDNVLHDIFSSIKTIAIIGAKDVAGQPVDRVGRYLTGCGYTVIPVHPVRQDVWGLPTYKSIADIPVAIDLVNVFRASEYCTGHAEEVLALHIPPKIFWMQLGISSPVAHRMLAAKEIAVIEDRCIMVEHKRLFAAA